MIQINDSNPVKKAINLNSTSIKGMTMENEQIPVTMLMDSIV